jgi:predicted amidohydrolase YtcJ
MYKVKGKLFHNAAFHQMNSDNSIAKAILVERGRIQEVFQSSPSLPDYESIDLQGAFVYPGFIDTHTHSFEGGLYSQSLDLSSVASVDMALEFLRSYYVEKKSAGAEQLDAFRYDENKVKEHRFPTRLELDLVCPDLPLVLRRIDGHSSVVNSKAWEVFAKANSDFLNTFSLSVSATTLAAENNILRGDLNDKLVHWFHTNFSEQTIFNCYHQAAKIALANGVTTVHTMVGDAQSSIMHYNLLRDNLDRFGVEFILYPQSFNIKAALNAGAKRIGGCILADGSLGSYTAALRQSYVGLSPEFGRLYHDDAFWNDFITQADANNLQVAVHCIGDRAIQQINNVYSELDKTGKKDLRHQLIHCELTPDDLLEEIVRSGAIPVMQPAFDLYWGADDGYYSQVLGYERSQKMNRFKSFMQNGVPITGGSDWYITELDALQGIHSAVNHHNASEQISAFEAIKMYTVNAAHLSHDDSRLGKIEAGYQADFVCLDNGLSDSEVIMTSKVLSTYKRGERVFQA